MIGPPQELVRAQILDGLLRRYPGHTLEMIERDGLELLRIAMLVEMGRPDGE